MAKRVKVIPNLYRDSVSLMQLSATLARNEGISQFSAFMASENNIGLLISAGLLTGSVEAGSNDLLLAAEGVSEEALDAVMAEAETALRQTAKQDDAREKSPPRSIAQAVEENPEASLVLIATPGEHAASEALKALRLGLNVMMFSDNVSLEDEILLKKEATARGLLVMGPDCGTAIVDGTPLAFANAVRRGDIGIVAASGTGLQHVSCHIHILGGGVSHALGTGGRDLKEAVGGLSALSALEALGADPNTRVVVIVSKPPAPSVMKAVLDKAAGLGKPVVAIFLGAVHEQKQQGNIHFVSTLEEAAVKAVELTGSKVDAPKMGAMPTLPKFAAGQKYIRGLFSGGTFCYETSILLGAALPTLKSNTPVTKAMEIADAWKSEGHCLIDLGDDEFTRGRPHPMIDQRLRCARLIEEACDPETAVVLLDVVLGYGANQDPATDLVEAIGEARKKAAAKGLSPVFVAYVCGTGDDPQNYAAQCKRLADAGVLLAPSNAQAAELALKIVTTTVA